MRLLDGNDVRDIVTIDLALEGARRVATASASPDLKIGRLEIQGDGIWLRTIAAAVPQFDLLGLKIFHGHSTDDGVRVVRYVCVLHRLSTGEPLALLDAAAITPFRTAAMASLAIGHYFGDTPMSVGFLGSGKETFQGLRTLAHSTAVRAARVYSPSPGSRTRFAGFARDLLDRDVETCESVADCVRGVDVVYAATSTGGSPILDTEMLAGVQYLATTGSTSSQQRETAPSVFSSAQVVVYDSEEVFEWSGDVLAVEQEGLLDRSRWMSYGAYLSTSPDTLRSGSGLTVYKSVGSAEQDLVLGHLILEEATRRNTGNVQPWSLTRVAPGLSLEALAQLGISSVEAAGSVPSA